MATIVLAFAIGFIVSQTISAFRISLFKGKIKLYEAYLHDRLDQGTEQLRKGLISH